MEGGSHPPAGMGLQDPLRVGLGGPGVLPSPPYLGQEGLGGFLGPHVQQVLVDVERQPGGTGRGQVQRQGPATPHGDIPTQRTPRGTGNSQNGAPPTQLERN